MSALENQAILLISPQPWDHIRVSKHHYAVELAERGNRVYFLEPPAELLDASVRMSPVHGVTGLARITYRPRFPFRIRFHARWLFDRLILSQVQRILSVIPEPLDLVWCFEFNLFSNLRAFRAKRVIFHPVDPISSREQLRPAASADAVISVSEQILSPFRSAGLPVWVINHGLSRPFEKATRCAADWRDQRKTRMPRVGYAGNLSRPALNRDVLRMMVSGNPQAEFHFWGPAESSSTFARRGDADFLSFLKAAPNVLLHGRVGHEQLAEEIQDMDCHVLSYARDERESDRSNSHKILEYLSTGKVIVSSRISSYVAHSDLIRMPPDDDDSVLPKLLTDTLNRLPEFNAAPLQERRREFALDNTYSKQIDRIATRLNALSQLRASPS
ncbi:MAG TPA: hypothetical protein VHM24_03860 [Gemmatimonadaceae bacterium]|nr:hypothetical protein [Gemmatimonadaceae bacterium]